MRHRFNAARRLVLRHQFLAAIVLVIVIAVVMTSASMTLYVLSGASGLDLSRPGFSAIRDDLQKESSDQFKATGSLNANDIATFKGLYEKQRSVLNVLGKFDANAMSDESLGLTNLDENAVQIQESASN